MGEAVTAWWKRRVWPPDEERDDDGDGVLRDDAFAHGRDAWPPLPSPEVAEAGNDAVTAEGLSLVEGEGVPRGVCAACGGDGYLGLESGGVESEAVCEACDGTGWRLGGIEYVPGQVADVGDEVDAWAQGFPGEVDPEYDREFVVEGPVEHVGVFGVADIAARFSGGWEGGRFDVDDVGVGAGGVDGRNSEGDEGPDAGSAWASGATDGAGSSASGSDGAGADCEGSGQ